MRTQRLMVAALAIAALQMAGAWAQQREFLRAGENLATNQYLVSSNKQFFAIQQTDGNFCVYRGSGPSDNKGGLWCHQKVAGGGEFVTVMQGDGNLCTYRTSRGAQQPGATWCSNAVAPGGQFFAIQQNDGNFCVYKGTSPADNKGGMWCHNTNVLPASQVVAPPTAPPAPAAQYTLTVSPAPSQGDITAFYKQGGTYAGVSCKAGSKPNCSKAFPAGTVLQLGTFDLGPGNAFKEWAGGCAGKPNWPCEITMNQNVTVTAYFTGPGTPTPGTTGTGTTGTGTTGTGTTGTGTTGTGTTGTGTTPSPLAGLVSVSKGAALSPTDTKAVLNWIGARVASDRQSYCWKQTYTRVPTGVPNVCPAGQQYQAGACYTPCQTNYTATGPVCWQQCPSGYTDTGALCHYSAKSLTASLVRTGCHLDSMFGCVIPAYDCPSGYTNVGAFCALNTPSVPAGYSGLTGLDLTKKSYTRAPSLPGCGSGENYGAACMPICKSGFTNIGLLCSQNCPSGKHECAAGCASSAAGCGMDTANMVIAPIMVAVNVVTAGSAGAVSTGTVATIKAGLKAAAVAGSVANASYQAGQTTYMWVNDYVGNFRQLTNDNINNTINAKFSPTAARWVKEQYAMVHLNMMMDDNSIQTALNVLNAASGFDPTGVSGVVSAYAKPICMTDDPFPNVSARY